MITIKSIQINNFLSHKETKLNLSDSTKLLIDGNSGSGKSSIVEALLWCLYGEARTDNKNLVRHGEKSAIVEVILFNSKNNEYYKIERKTTDKAKNSLSVSSSNDGENYLLIERNGLKDTQEWIEKDLLKASYALFINSIAYPQDNVENFVKQTATKRKDLLLEIANVSNFDFYYSRAREIIQSKNEEKINIDTIIKTLGDLILKQKEEIVDEDSLSQNIVNLEEEKKRRNNELEVLLSEKSKVGDFTPDINRIKIQISDKEKERASLLNTRSLKLNIISDINSFDIESIKKNVLEGERLSKRKEELFKKISDDNERNSRIVSLMSDKPIERDYDSEILELNKRLIPLIKETGSCPSGDKCPFVIPIKNQIAYLEDQIKEKGELKSRLDQAMAEYQKRLNEIGPSFVTDDERKEFRDISQKVSNHESSIKILAQHEERLKTIPDIELEIVKYGEKIIFLDNEINSLSLELKEKEDAQKGVDITSFTERESLIRDSIKIIDKELINLNHKLSVSKENRKNVISYEEKIESNNETLKKINTELEELNLVKDAFGSKGLKTVVIDYLIPRLEDKINEILSRLSDFRVRLDTQKSSSDGENTIEGLFINIFNEKGDQFEFSNYSGGEKLKISIAISEALASLQKCGFRIFDEAIVGLSQDMTEEFVSVLNELQSQYSQVLCISHLPEVKQIFEEVITVSKINGVSVVS